MAIGFLKKPNVEMVKKSNIEAVEKPKEITPADLEEKIWVEGYKIVRPNRTGYNDFKFELNTVYTVERPEEIKPGHWGFHFWKNLYHGADRYHTGDRIFKVRALVPKVLAELDQYAYNNYYYPNDVDCWGRPQYAYLNQIVASSIELIEEVMFEDYKDHVHPYYDSYLFKNNEDYKDYLNFCEENIDSTDDLYDKYFDLKAKEILDECQLPESLQVIMLNGNHNFYYYHQIKAYYDTNISRDMFIYLISKLGI